MTPSGRARSAKTERGDRWDDGREGNATSGGAARRGGGGSVVVGQGGGAHEEGVGFSVVVGVVDAGRGDEAVGRKGQVDSAATIDLAVDHFGPTATATINNLLKPITTPIRNEWMNLVAGDEKTVLKGGFFGAFSGISLGMAGSRGPQASTRHKVEQMPPRATSRSLVDDFSPSAKSYRSTRKTDVSKSARFARRWR